MGSAGLVGNVSCRLLFINVGKVVRFLIFGARIWSLLYRFLGLFCVFFLVVLVCVFFWGWIVIAGFASFFSELLNLRGFGDFEFVVGVIIKDSYWVVFLIL